MKKQLLFILLLLPICASAQRILAGKIQAEADLEGIHVYNKTRSSYTITNHLGRFELPVQLQDTVVFSGLQYKVKSVVITEAQLQQEELVVPLEIQVNELSEVVIRPKLSGNLGSDIKNIKTIPPVTSTTLGLPNAHVKPPTQAQRKLYTATSTNTDLILNALSGRLKKLKRVVRLEKRTNLENNALQEFDDVIIHEFGVPEDLIYDFIYFVSDDPKFQEIMRKRDMIVLIEFLRTKSKIYLKIKEAQH